MTNAPPQTHMNPTGIINIVAERLFGEFDYHLAPRAPDASTIFILYGDNGSGKTTILRLLYHLLIPERGGGHRTFLAKTQFQRFSVGFADGTRVEAVREPGQTLGSFTVAISRHGQLAFEMLLPVDAEGAISGRFSPPEELKYDEFLEQLRKLGVTLHFLRDDRTLESDQVRQTTEWTMLEQGFVATAPEGWVRTRRAQECELLEDAVRRAEEWIGTQAVRGSTAGDANAATSYTDIVRRIATPPAGMTVEGERPIAELCANLQVLAERSKEFSQIGLVAPLKVEELTAAIVATPQLSRHIVYSVVTPYIDGVRARLDALESLKSVVITLLRNMSLFYAHKRVHFTLGQGFSITSSNGKELSLEMLSSGERQLLLLLCNTVLARAQATIFMIDEPEISLNVKWERRLIQALLECVQGSNVQFIFATHSLEILARHRQNVAKLVDQSVLGDTDAAR